MELEFFEKNFRNAVDGLLKEEIISDKDDDLGVLMFCSWTFLFNIAVYQVVKKWNTEIKDELRLIPEDNSGKKGGFSDLSIISDDGKIKFIEIEHENNPDKLISGYEKLTESDAKHRILIGYENEKMPKADILSLLKQRKNRLGTDKKVHLLIAPEKLTKGNEYDLEEI